MDLALLTQKITDLNQSLRGAVASSVNHIHTMRNWLIGMHIVEYEQKGDDRAKYGSGLLRLLSEKLTLNGQKGFSQTNLKLFRQFYTEYPRLGVMFIVPQKSISQEVSDQSAIALEAIGQKPSDQLHNTHDNQLVRNKHPDPEKLVKHFSFSHFIELMRIAEPIKTRLLRN